MSLKQCHNISDLRGVAESRLPRPMFDYSDGGVRRGTHVLKSLALLRDMALLGCTSIAELTQTKIRPVR